MLSAALEHISKLAIGGTAVGTGMNAPKSFDCAVCDALSEYTGFPFVPDGNKFHALTSKDALVFTHGGLKALAKLSYREIRALGIGGIGRVKAMELAAAIEIGRRAADQAPTAEMPLVNDPEAVYRLLEPRTRAMRTEVFWVLPLNSKNRLIDHPFDASKGTADSSPANPRDVLSPAVRVNAVSIIVAHNHPSGDPTPSSADIRVTRQIVEAGRLLGLRILDHVIIGQPAQNRAGYLSIRQQGLVQFE